MRVTCLQDNLARGLALVGRAVATRSTLPVLSNILLTTDQSRLKLSATNLEISISCWLGAQVMREGATTVPARLLADFVTSLPAEPINMELITRTQTLNLKCGRFEANIKGIDAQEFPLIMAPEEDDRVQIDPAVLRQIIDQVAFAAATDESRPVLTGVLVELSKDKLTLAAADSYRLAVRSTAFDGGPSRPISVIIPARSLQELARIMGETDKPVEILVAPSRSQAFFHAASGPFDVDLISQLIEGAFPDYRQIVPTAYNTRTVAKTAELLQAVRTALIFARDSANIVRLQIMPGTATTSGQVVITATSAEHGDNVSELDAEVEGVPLDIAFNARYLIEVLSVIGAERAALETRDNQTPGVIRPVDGGDYVHVIMPMHVAR